MSALTDTFTSIANAIRTKLGVQTTYTPAQMSTAIASIPTQKPEQTKSVTATTSAQTVTPDSGKVLSSVTVNPQVHSATYTPTGYSNANDMGAQNNYRYVDTSAYEPTSITPSNSSPATITSGGLYSATAGGKAVSIITEVTPVDFGVPTAVSADDVVHLNDSGSITKLYSITPSNTSPPSLGNMQSYYVGGGSGRMDMGYAIQSYTFRTPSTTNRSRTTMSVNSVNIMQTRGGYLYGVHPTGRVLLASMMTADTSGTGWHKVDIAETAFDPDGTWVGTVLDDNFAHLYNGDIIVDREIATAYIAGGAYRGRTSSGTRVYSGIELRKNGTAVVSVMGNSTTSNQTFRRVSTSFAVGDVISIYTKVSSTTAGDCRQNINITTP